MNPQSAAGPFPLGPQGLVARPGLPLREVLTVGLLPSELKLWLYRRRGWMIGRNVSIGPGSVLVGSKVQIGDEVAVGALSILRASNMVLQRGARIGRSTVLAVPRLSIGEDAEVDDHVWASAGYARAESALDLGGFTILMRHSYVNCSMGVTVGEGSGIGGHCLIFTHGYWLSWLEGYPRQLAPVHIGRDVWLPWRVFVMPGAVIGDGCVIGANSTVSGAIAPLSLAAGSPAVVTKTFKGRLPVEEAWRRLQLAMDDFLAQMGHHGIRVDGHRLFDLAGRQGSLRLVGPDDALPAVDSLPAGDTVVSIAALPDDWRAAAERAGLPWFDIGVKERSDRQNPVGRELVACLAGYGMRFRRC